MSNNGKEGERLFIERMAKDGYKVKDVSGNNQYFDKDIDLIIVNPATGNERAFEVKWCEKINKTNNLFLEFINPRSEQWNYDGWWPHCKADFLAYGDAVNRKFYVFNMEQLKARVEPIWNSLETRSTYDGSVGRLLPLHRVKDLAMIMEVE